MENLIGLTIDNFKLTSILGKGGMGVVYKADDIKLDRPVAIKMINGKLFNEERHIERFKREAKNQAKLNHPNIVSVYGFIEYNGFLGIVMEYVEGESLEKVLYRQKRFNIFDSIYILKQLLAGLDYAHSKGFVHRDIKPSNIIFNSEGIAKIMDFGISKSAADKKFTKPGSKLGTVYYMSPEQVRGEDVDLLTDIYAVGCTFYEMLTGYPPFDYKSEYEVMDAHVKNEPPKVVASIPGSPKMIDGIIHKALSKNPAERFQDDYEFLLAIEELEKKISSISENNHKTALKKKKNVKIFSIASVVIFLGVFVAVSYFVFDQVQYLLNSGKIEDFDKKHNMQSLFNDDESLGAFKTLKVETGIGQSINALRVLENASFILGDEGMFLTKQDSSSGWTVQDLNTKKNILDGYFSSKGNSFIIGDSSLFLKSVNSSEQWAPVNIERNRTLSKIKFIDDNNGFVLGSQGLVLYTTDKGENWRQADIEPNKILYDISFIDEQTGFIVGWKGALYKTVDGGFTWEIEKPFTQKYLKSIDFGSEDVGVTVGGGGVIYMTNNGGKSWYELEQKYPSGLQTVKFLDESRALIAGNRGLVLYSDNSGKTWKQIQTGFFTSFKDIELTPEGEVYLCGDNGMVLKLF